MLYELLFVGFYYIIDLLIWGFVDLGFGAYCCQW